MSPKSRVGLKVEPFERALNHALGSHHLRMPLMCLSGTTSRWSTGPDRRQADGAVEHWTEREIDKTAFKDARLGQRFGELLKQIGDGMGGSIPFACQDGRTRRRPTASSPTTA